MIKPVNYIIAGLVNQFVVYVGCKGPEQVHFMPGIDILTRLETSSESTDVEVTPASLEVGLLRRRCVKFPEDGILIIRDIEIPPGAKLEFSFGALTVDDRTGVFNASIFVTSVEDDSVMFRFDQSGYLSGEWHDDVVDLADLAGNKVNISFEVQATRKDQDIYLGNPFIKVSNNVGKHVILVCVDAYRRDHFDIYTGNSGLTPNLDSLANESVRFNNAYSAAPWTFPSVAAVATGKYPGDSVYNLQACNIPDDEVTIAEYYRNSGYRTASFIANMLASNNTGYFQGFEMEMGIENLDIKEITSAALDWLDHHSDENTFMYLHFMEPHGPYRPPEPYKSDYSAGNGRYRNSFGWRAMRNAGDFTATEGEKLQIKGLYNGCVAYFDTEFGKFINDLKAGRFWDTTSLVLFADHGEELWDHGAGGHGHSLYNELIHVPLIMHAPGVDPAVRDDLVSLVDIKPTLLGISGIHPDDEISGIDVLNIEPDEERSVFSEGLLYGSEQKSVVLNNWKLVLGFGEDDSTRLINLADDPLEMTDLSESEPELGNFLMGKLITQTASSSPGFHVRIQQTENAPSSSFTLTVKTDEGNLSSPTYNSLHVYEESHEVDANEISYSATLQPGGFAEISFTVEPEDAEVSFDVIGDTPELNTWYLGASEVPTDGQYISLNMLDERISWSASRPQGDHAIGGVFIWSYPPSLADNFSTTASDEVLDTLRSLGYIN